MDCPFGHSEQIEGKQLMMDKSSCLPCLVIKQVQAVNGKKDR